MDATPRHRRSTMAIIATGVSLALLGVSGGCRAAPYRLGTVSDYVVSAELAPLTEPPVELGRRMPVLDTIGWVIGIPSKIILWDRRVDNHAVSTETMQNLLRHI